MTATSSRNPNPSLGVCYYPEQWPPEKWTTDLSRSDDPAQFYGGVLDFDHFALSEDLDAAGWDSYPLGFLSEMKAPDAHKTRYLRSGDPDFVGFHHDLYRTCGRGRWWVLEQQPGPVNWAAYNPAPHPGMIRFWTLEAFAH